MTPQRQAVLKVLTESHDHPSAHEVHTRVKFDLPAISLATVYNCLDTLLQHGVIRQVTLDRQPSRFCANRHEHAHFHCDRCGKVTDAELSADSDAKAQWSLPPGASIHQVETTLRGLCPDCMATLNRQTLT